jgi:hypothetical protein
VVQQLVTAVFPAFVGVFYGVAGVGVFALSLCFNGALLLTQPVVGLQEYLPTVCRLLAVEAPVGESHAVSAPLWGAKIQFQPLARVASLKSFLHHY